MRDEIPRLIWPVSPRQPIPTRCPHCGSTRFFWSRYREYRGIGNAVPAMLSFGVALLVPKRYLVCRGCYRTLGRL